MLTIPPIQFGPLSAIAFAFLSIVVRVFGKLSLTEIGSDLSLSALVLHFEYLLDKLSSQEVPLDGNLAIYDAFFLIGLMSFWLVSLTLVRHQIETNYRLKGIIPLYAIISGLLGGILIIFEMFWRMGIWF